MTQFRTTLYTYHESSPLNAFPKCLLMGYRKIMKFITEKVCQNSSGRSGKFLKDGASFPTPLLLQTTKVSFH